LPGMQQAKSALDKREQDTDLQELKRLRYETGHGEDVVVGNMSTMRRGAREQGAIGQGAQVYEESETSEEHWQSVHPAQRMQKSLNIDFEYILWAPSSKHVPVCIK